MSIFTFLAKYAVSKHEMLHFLKIKNSWVYMFWTFNLSFDILATVLATFPNIGQLFSQFSGHSGRNDQLMIISWKVRIQLCWQ
jgi:hypothetical protein